MIQINKKIKLIIAMLFTTGVIYSQIPEPFTYAGKTYHPIKIGTQIWLKENLDVGTMVNGFVDQTNNGIVEKYYYDNDPLNSKKYGGLYTWTEAMNYNKGEKNAQGICPPGWNIPTLKDFQILKAAVNDDGSSLKDVTQGVGLSTGTNTSGFSAMLGGSRGNVRENGSPFSHAKVYALFWSSTEYDDNYAYAMDLDYSNNTINLYGNGKAAAFSIRCIKTETSVTDVEKMSDKIPADYFLSKAFPNPFNPSTTIKFSIPKAGNVKLTVYDILGKEVSTLVNNFLNAGEYNFQFNASSANGGLASGIYLYRLETNNFVKTNKMLLMK